MKVEQKYVDMVAEYAETTTRVARHHLETIQRRLENNNITTFEDAFEIWMDLEGHVKERAAFVDECAGKYNTTYFNVLMVVIKQCLMDEWNKTKGNASDQEQTENVDNTPLTHEHIINDLHNKIKSVSKAMDEALERGDLSSYRSLADVYMKLLNDAKLRPVQQPKE